MLGTQRPIPSAPKSARDLCVGLVSALARTHAADLVGHHHSVRSRRLREEGLEHRPPSLAVDTRGSDIAFAKLTPGDRSTLHCRDRRPRSPRRGATSRGRPPPLVVIPHARSGALGGCMQWNLRRRSTRTRSQLAQRRGFSARRRRPDLARCGGGWRAAPGRTSSGALGSSVGEQMGERAGSTRPTAFLGDQSGAIDRDLQRAVAVRLPERDCSIHNLPRSTVTQVLHVAIWPRASKTDRVERFGHRLFLDRAPPPFRGGLVRYAGTDAGDDIPPCALISHRSTGALAGGDRVRRRRGRGGAHIAEHHRLHMRRGAPLRGESGGIDFRGRFFPTAKTGRRPPQLVFGSCGKARRFRVRDDR